MSDMSAAAAGEGPAQVQPLEFDLEALRLKYRQERDKRVRQQGVHQYVRMTGELAHYAVDPYVNPGFSRAPRDETVDVLIMGGGFGGLLAAVRLRQAGFRDIRIIEKAGDFGGVWYWNRYPGAQCDTESYIYLPLLEETGFMPTRKYASGSEILAHARRIGETFDLYDRAIFQTAVTDMTWQEEAHRWLVRTDRDDQIRARFVITCSGPMERPKLPGIPGVGSFGGHTFHTSRWDYAYTGGDIAGNLTGLADKRVAVIGTGCTAIQCVPHLAESAKQLFVFQRTPSTIDARGNGPTDPRWVRSLAPGWQRRRNVNFVLPVVDGHEQGGLLLGRPRDEDLIDDAWTESARRLNAAPQGEAAAQMSPEEIALAQEIEDHRKLNELRARIDDIVQDKATAAALKPWYRLMCKRPGFSDEYLPAFNRPNVTLVDTEGRGVDAIDETGLTFGGVHYDVDCIIFATGFEVGGDYDRTASFNVRGRDGRALAEHWAEGIRTFQGFHTHGFPNYIHMGPVQGGISTNIPHLLDEQSRHIAELLQSVRLRQATRVEATAEAEAEWVATIRQRAGATKPFWDGCSPGYFNNEGAASNRGLIENVYVGKPLEYFDLIDQWRRTGRLEGLDVR